MPEQRSSPAPAGVLRAVFAVALVATLATPAGASARWFSVEIVVFDDLRNESLHAEHWPANPGEPSLRGAVEPTRASGTEPEGTLHAYRLMTPSELSLGAVWNSLRRSAHYRPLMHAGWRLPGLSRDAAHPVHVGPGLGEGGAGAAGRASAGRATVHGTVTVSLARYLQVDVDLLYTRPASDVAGAPDAASDTAPEATPTRFRLVSERRMRSGELHYIDHPLFGVLVLLTRL